MSGMVAPGPLLDALSQPLALLDAEGRFRAGDGTEAPILAPGDLPVPVTVETIGAEALRASILADLAARRAALEAAGSFARLSPRDETMIAIRGRLVLVVFDDAGEVIEVVRFGAQGGAHAAPFAAGVLVPAGAWHTVLALDDDAILFETKAGPFDPAVPKEPAPWAPAEGSMEAGAYLVRLRALVW